MQSIRAIITRVDDELTMTDIIRKYSNALHPPVSYQSKDTIIEPGNTISSLYYLSEGFVRSFFLTPDGDDHTVNILKPGTIFPLTPYLSRHQNNYFFAAFTPARVIVLDAERFISQVRTRLDFWQNLSVRLSSGLEGYLEHSFSLVSGNAREKIASTLLMLSRRFGYPKIDLPLTQADLGSLTGLTREKVSTEVNRFIREKTLSRQGKYLSILKKSALTDLAIFPEI